MTPYSSFKSLRGLTRKTVIITVFFISITMAGTNIISAVASDGVQLGINVPEQVYQQVHEGNNEIIVSAKAVDNKQIIIQRISDELGLRVVDDLDELPSFVVEGVTIQDVKTISSYDGVVGIESIFKLSSTSLDYIKAVHGYNVANPSTPSQELSGKGVVIGIMDAGLGVKDGLFNDDNSNSRIVSQGCVDQEDYDFNPCDATPGKEANVDCASEKFTCWHGHTVAGIAAGASYKLTDEDNHKEYEFQGIAQEADINYFRIVASVEKGPDSISILTGLNKFLKDVKENPSVAPDVINISIGFDPQADPDCNRLVSIQVAISILNQQGVSVVAAAGNNGNKSKIDTPACFQDSIAVGASEYSLDENGDIIGEKIADYSNTSDTLDVVAPGSGMLGVSPEVGAHYFGIRGTSFASPIVAGAVALLKEANPRLTPLQIRNILVSTGDPIQDLATGKSFPRINIERAVLAAKDVVPPTVPSIPVTTPDTQIPGSTLNTVVTTAPSQTSQIVASTSPQVEGTQVYTNGVDAQDYPTYTNGVDAQDYPTYTTSQDTLPFTGSSTSMQLVFAGAWILLAGIMLLCFRQGFTRLNVSKIDISSR